MAIKEKSFLKNNKRYILVFSLLFLALVVALGVFGFKWYKHENGENYPYKISIIVPVYNTEKYLDECLKTLEDQTLKDIEIICVNDGSKDSSLQILERHAASDKRIKIIDKENGGVCSARNAGIRVAEGEYISFIDSDDLVPNYAMEKAYNDLKKYNVEVVSFKLETFIDGDAVDLSNFKYDPSKVKVCERSQNQNPFYDMVENTGYIVTKVYKKSLIVNNNIWFKEGITHYEDQLFNLLLFPSVTKMVQDDNIFYLYRTNRPGSAVTEFNAKKVLTASTKVSEELINNFDKFNFERGHEWLVSKIFDLNYNHITKDTKNIEDKRHFAAIVVNLIEEKLVKERGVKLENWHKDSLKVLKTLT